MTDESIQDSQEAIKDFPDETLEQMFFSEIVTNSEFASRVVQIFKDKWIADDELRPMCLLILKWRQRFPTEITKDLVHALLKKYVSDKPNCGINVDLCMQKFTMATNLDLGGLSKIVRIKTLNEFIKKNIVKDAFVQGAKLLGSGKLNGVVDSCLGMLEEAERLAFDDADCGLSYTNETMNDASKNQMVASHFQTLCDPGSKISTGWPSIDSYTNGGFLKNGKSIYIVMGQAGLGKTVALTNLGFNFLCQGLKVVIFTLEMSNDMYARRFDSLISNVGLDELGPLVSVVQERVKGFFANHPTAELIIKEFPPRTANVNTFGAFIDNIAKEKGNGWKPDVILVDYLNLVQSTTAMKEESMYQEGLRVSEQLRALSYRFEAPVITAVQVNSEGMDTDEVGMKNISQSRGIAHTADFIMAIYRNDNLIKGKIIKNRLGTLPTESCIGFRRDENTLRMIDMQSDYEEEQKVEAVKEMGNTIIPESLKDMVGEL